jgi:hypothetical protein
LLYLLACTENYQKKIKIITSLLWAHGWLPKGML